jgi:uncharacterized protein
MENQKIEKWIEKLGLKRHPEGGYFTEVYRAKDRVLCNKIERSACTSIYFLLPASDISVLHQIKSDELWHFYEGSPLTVHMIDRQGKYRNFVLGKALESGQCLQNWVPAGCWFGATVEEGFALVGCTVAPGFEFEDFRMADRIALQRQFPQHMNLIAKLTHSN